ncbi:MAG: aldo/keto reductase [Planctomycetota bacterium]
MEYVPLGRAGVKVSRLCLGTMNFGPLTDEADSHAILDRARDAGVNFLDTANVYGRSAGKGATEAIVGRWLAAAPGRRDEVVLATKVFGQMGEGVNDAKLSAYHIRQACEDSLRRLQTDRIDLYQMHHVWREVTWDEVWQAFELLVQQGKVLYVGSSNFAAWNVVQGCETARQRHLLGLVSEQSLYHLLERSIELEVLPACRAYGVAVLPWSPLAGGVLAAKGEGVRRQEAFQEPRRAKLAGRPDAWLAFCEELGEEPAAVALAWLLHREGVTAPIIGPRTMEQFEGALRALEIRLDAAKLARLDELFPGPGDQAPEAYAW